MAKAAQDEDTRAEFRVNEKSFLAHAVHEEGASFYIDPETYPEDSEIGENLSPVNAAAQAMVDAQKGPHPDKTANKKPAKPAKAAPAAVEPAPQAEEQAADDLA